MDLMRQARAAFYTTPGIDGQEKRTQGFNQVTPRFLEMLACGCHVLTRYASNPDTLFFELERISESIDSYEVFEHQLNLARRESIDADMYQQILSKHWTSERAKLLQTILHEVQPNRNKISRRIR
jgi:hypothetical protein